MKDPEKLVALVKYSEDSATLRKAVVDQLGKKILELASVMSGVIGAGGKILIAGNGGSASMSCHFAAELIVRLTSERNRQALPAMSLTSDTSVLTAAGNDYGFDTIFARQVEGLAKLGDMLIVMSTSGNSENLIKAIQAARQKQVITAALLGGDGGLLAKQVDKPLVIPHPSTQRIQEEHLFLVHQLVELVEMDLFA
jgi:D-sedoheptulose 7-phosphate isomerase